MLKYFQFFFAEFRSRQYLARSPYNYYYIFFNLLFASVHSRNSLSPSYRSLRNRERTRYAKNIAVSRTRCLHGVGGIQSVGGVVVLVAVQYIGEQIIEFESSLYMCAAASIFFPLPFLSSSLFSSSSPLCRSIRLHFQSNRVESQRKDAAAPPLQQPVGFFTISLGICRRRIQCSSWHRIIHTHTHTRIPIACVQSRSICALFCLCCLLHPATFDSSRRYSAMERERK